MATPPSTRWTALIEALARLDPESREIILLSDVLGLSREEVATRLGLSLWVTGRQLALARSRLQLNRGCESTHP